MRKLFLLLILSASLSSCTSMFPLGTGRYDRDNNRFETTTRPNGPMGSNRPNRPANQRQSYYINGSTVYYNGKKVSGASASSFRDLGSEYAKDNRYCYYAGKKISGASSSSFRVLTDGYAKDSRYTYRYGKKVR